MSGRSQSEADGEEDRARERVRERPTRTDSNIYSHYAGVHIHRMSALSSTIAAQRNCCRVVVPLTSPICTFGSSKRPDKRRAEVSWSDRPCQTHRLFCCFATAVVF